MRRACGVVIALVVVVVVAVATPGHADERHPVPRPPGVGPDLAPAAPSSALSEVEDRFLTTRPAVGPTHVVTIAGEGTGRTLTARTLQGIVNRSSARLYLIDGGDPSAQVLLDRYVARGLVTVTGTSGLDGALDLFAGELAGYVLADPAEPWSVHGAAVIAGIEGGIVATADQVPALEARGLAELDDTRNRWPDAVTAYTDLAGTYAEVLPSDTMAVVRPGDTLWDFVVQQGLLPVFTRPGDPSWSAVQALFAAIPDGSPVYGYLSDTGEEEAIAVAALASDELALVPTDTTRNLSFHVAVGADRPRVPMTPPDLSEVDPCDPDTVNVVVGLTDGDNMNVPLNHFLRPSNWNAATRGDLPIGWSIGPDLAVLAPAAWDTYALEATDRDELVAMIGWAYSAPALLDDPADFYATSFALMEELGMRTFWSLGGGLDTASSPYWDDFDAAAGSGPPAGVLVGYGNATGSAFHSPAGRPAFTSRSVYSETPADLVQHVTDLLATPPDQRPIVSFLSATNWSNPADAVIAALAPFDGNGVRFLTPAEATACMPPPPEPPDPPVLEPGTCLPTGTITPHGLELISVPTVAEIGASPLGFELPATVAATPSVAPGEVIDYETTVSVDLASFAQRTLDERIRPIIAAGYGPELAASAWQALAFEHLTIPFPLPAGTAPTGTPVVTAAPPGVTASWTGSGPAAAMAIDIGSAQTDTRLPEAPFEITATWSVVVDPATTTSSVPLLPGAVSFDLILDIGVLLGTVPLSGGAEASWRCRPAGAALATTAVVAGPVDPVDPTPPSSEPGPPPPPGPTDPDLARAPAATAAPNVGDAPVAVAVAVAPRLTG